MENKIKSTIFNKEYYAHEAVKILDPTQAALYWIHGLQPLDMYPSRDRKTGRAIIVYVFSRIDSKPLYDLWCKYELK